MIVIPLSLLPTLVVGISSCPLQGSAAYCASASSAATTDQYASTDAASYLKIDLFDKSVHNVLKHLDT